MAGRRRVGNCPFELRSGPSSTRFCLEIDRFTNLLGAGGFDVDVDPGSMGAPEPCEKVNEVESAKVLDLELSC